MLDSTMSAGALAIYLDIAARNQWGYQLTTSQHSQISGLRLQQAQLQAFRFHMDFYDTLVMRI